jgi:hypothetical protein
MRPTPISRSMKLDEMRLWNDEMEIAPGSGDFGPASIG